MPHWLRAFLLGFAKAQSLKLRPQDSRSAPCKSKRPLLTNPETKRCESQVAAVSWCPAACGIQAQPGVRMYKGPQAKRCTRACVAKLLAMSKGKYSASISCRDVYAEYNTERISSASLKLATAHAVSCSAPYSAVGGLGLRWSIAQPEMILLFCFSFKSRDHLIPRSFSLMRTSTTSSKGLGNLKLNFASFKPRQSQILIGAGSRLDACARGKILGPKCLSALTLNSSWEGHFSFPTCTNLPSAELPWMELYLRICSGGSMSRALPCGEGIGLRALVRGLDAFGFI